MSNEKKKKKTNERITLEESAKNLQRTIDKYKHYKPPETRGVKKGSVRGSYSPRKTGQIKDKKFITEKCKQCRQKFRYKRIGKRKRKYCSDS